MVTLLCLGSSLERKLASRLLVHSLVVSLSSKAGMLLQIVFKTLCCYSFECLLGQKKNRTDLETNLAQSSKNITTELCVISITERRRSTLYSCTAKDKNFLIGTKNQTFITFIAFYSVKWSQSYVTVQAIFVR